jgi:hypothetical protein
VSVAAERRPTRLGRTLDYLAVLFPPIPMLVAAAISFAAVYFLFEALAHPRLVWHEPRAKLVYTWRALGAIVTGWSMSLLLRIYDELKDVETDRRLGATGDPKYASRPIVRGAVDVDDLQALKRVLQGGVILLNLFLGPVVFAAFAVLFVASWMSSRWFFWPQMKDHLMVAFATHNPLTLLLQIYGAVVFGADFGFASVPLLPVAATLLAQQALASAWEVARKIRAPQDETDYVTYSKVLGWRAAPLLPALAVALSAGCVLWVGARAELHPAYLIAVGVAAAVTLGAFARFRLAPSARTSNLRPYVEAFAGVVNVGAVVALVAKWGVALAPIK